jgi:hypothetical protein
MLCSLVAATLRLARWVAALTDTARRPRAPDLFFALDGGNPTRTTSFFRSARTPPADLAILNFDRRRRLDAGRRHGFCAPKLGADVACQIADAFARAVIGQKNALERAQRGCNEGVHDDFHPALSGFANASGSVSRYQTEMPFHPVHVLQSIQPEIYSACVSEISGRTGNPHIEPRAKSQSLNFRTAAQANVGLNIGIGTVGARSFGLAEQLTSRWNPRLPPFSQPARPPHPTAPQDSP